MMMKLTQNLLLAAFFLTFMACGGASESDNTDTKDSTKTEGSTDTTPTTEEATDSKESATLPEEAKPFIKEWAMTEYTHEDGKEEKGINNAFLNLKEDGKFAEIFAGKTVAAGVWTVEKEGDKLQLILTHTSGEMSSQLTDGKEKLIVKEISADKMVTVDDGGKMTETFVPKK